MANRDHQFTNLPVTVGALVALDTKDYMTLGPLRSRCMLVIDFSRDGEDRWGNPQRAELKAPGGRQKMLGDALLVLIEMEQKRHAKAGETITDDEARVFVLNGRPETAYEEPHEFTAREVFEETGIVIDITSDDPSDYPKGDRRWENPTPYFDLPKPHTNHPHTMRFYLTVTDLHEALTQGDENGRPVDVVPTFTLEQVLAAQPLELYGQEREFLNTHISGIAGLRPMIDRLQASFDKQLEHA